MTDPQPISVAEAAEMVDAHAGIPPDTDVNMSNESAGRLWQRILATALAAERTDAVALSDEEVAERVAEMVGMGQYAWDMVPSKELVQAFRAVLAAERRWVPVSERVPEKGGRYLVCHIEDGYSNCWGEALFVGGLWSGFLHTVTHWAYPLPLPDQPEV